MFIAALLIVGKNWRKLRCPSVDEWRNCNTSAQLIKKKKKQRKNKLTKTLVKEEYIIYASIYMTSWKIQNYRQNEQISEWQGRLEGGRGIGKAQEIL